MYNKTSLFVCFWSIFFTTIAKQNFNINTVVIPAAGTATRFFPWTKTVAKELLPVGTTPAIEVVVQEAIDAGCSHIVIVTNARKPMIMHYLEQAHLPVQITYVTQKDALGLGHAVYQAHHAVQEDYFAVILPDELCMGDTPGIKQLMEIARAHQAAVVAVQEVPAQKVSAFGIVAPTKQLAPDLVECGNIIEKPQPDKAPSRLALTGRYVLPTKIFDILATTKPGAKNEIQITDAIATLIKNGDRVLAYTIKGERHDIGTPLGWLKAITYFGLKNPKYGPEFMVYLTTLTH